MNAKDVANKIKIACKKILNSKKGRIGLITTICCAVAVTAVSVSAIGSLHAESNMVKPKTQSTLSIPTIIEKVQPVSDENSMSSSVASTVSVASNPSTAAGSSASTSSSTPAQKSPTSQSKQSSQTHYVVVEPASSRAETNTPATTPSSATSGHVANYKGVNKTKTYTDEITGLQENVEFFGVGAGYCEVAGAGIDFVTTAALGAAHAGTATATLSGPVNETNPAVIGKTGQTSGFAIENLTPGTYTAKLTANDGTVVAQIHFTVQSGGLV